MGRKKSFVGEDGREYVAKEKKPFYKKWWFWLLAIIVVGSALGGGDDEGDSDIAGANDASIESVESESIIVESETVESEEAEAESLAPIEEEESKEELPAPSEVQFDPNDYDTGLTYEDLARNPDEHAFKAVTFEGSIIQVMQGDGYTQYRIAINDDYDQVMLIEVDSSQLESRILENDYIKFYGTYFGEVTYESVLGGNITVPSIVVEKFELQ